MRAKQKIRRIYGILENQFRRIYAEAERRRGQTGENLLQLLEGRLDSVAYRMGFGASRAEARQLVRHNGVLVNGKRVNIPSYLVRPGDVIELTESARKQLRVQAALKSAQERGFPEWVEVNVAEGKGVFKAYPMRAELSPTLNEQAVVELYSR
uniref:Small ribosomal subunit protein uS4 n=1 Tax=uncultured beta proteobacterium TaxID=86027 RepID=H5SGX6_9PROT|nr:30S ribosomal protein S4 [uncultured beta proteobacterium]